jgi:arginyl-tRNA synthetase
MDSAARDVGVGAVALARCYTNRIRTSCSVGTELSLDGETVPSSSTPTRACCSVLAKAGECAAAPDFRALCDAYAQQLISALDKFPQAAADAMERNEPSPDHPQHPRHRASLQISSTMRTASSTTIFPPEPRA